MVIKNIEPEQRVRLQVERSKATGKRKCKKDNQRFQTSMSNKYIKIIPVARYSGAAYPYVPITLVETWLLSPVGPSLAKPKSDSFAL